MDENNQPSLHIDTGPDWEGGGAGARLARPIPCPQVPSLRARARAYVRTCVHMRVLADAVRACVRASELARALSLRCTELAVPCAGSCGSRLGRMEQRGSGSLYPFCQCGQSCERLREYAHGKTSFQSPCLEYCHVAFQHPAM